MSVYKEIAFGNDQWARCFGDDVVKDEDMDEEFSSLPWNIDRILESRCPIFPEEKIKDTHMLVRLPKTLNGGLTLKSLGELAKRNFQDTEKGYRFIWEYIINELGDKSIGTSRWVLMTKDVLPKSRSKSYTRQQVMIAELAQKNIGYEVPETLEAVACIFAQYFGSNIRLFSNDSCAYTRCKENIKGNQNIVGGFASAGLCVIGSRYADGNIGVAALRKFF